MLPAAPGTRDGAAAVEGGGSEKTGSDVGGPEAICPGPGGEDTAGGGEADAGTAAGGDGVSGSNDHCARAARPSSAAAAPPPTPETLNGSGSEARRCSIVGVLDCAVGATVPPATGAVTAGSAAARAAATGATARVRAPTSPARPSRVDCVPTSGRVHMRQTDQAATTLARYEETGRRSCLRAGEGRGMSTEVRSGILATINSLDTGQVAPHCVCCGCHAPVHRTEPPERNRRAALLHVEPVRTVRQGAYMSVTWGNFRRAISLLRTDQTIRLINAKHHNAQRTSRQSRPRGGAHHPPPGLQQEMHLRQRTLQRRGNPPGHRSSPQHDDTCRMIQLRWYGRA